MSYDPWIMITILGMAFVTALTRFSGYWLIGRFAIRGRLAAALEAMPVAVLVSIITPTALAKGYPETLAVLVTVILALRAPALVAIAGGVVIVVLARMFLVNAGL